MEKKQTAVEWLVEQIKSDQNQKALSASEWMQVIEQAKQMEHQQQVDLLKFSKEMCTPEAPIDYIIKEFEKWKKQ